MVGGAHPWCLDIFSIQDKRVPIAVGIIIGVGVGIGIGIEGQRMGFGHEKLDVYRTSIEYVGWAYRFCETLKGHRNAKDQLLRASQAIPLDIAEGNGKATDGDRRRYFQIARSSALECGAIQDVLQVCGALSPKGKSLRSTQKRVLGVAMVL